MATVNMANKRGKYKKHKDNPTSFVKMTWEVYQAKYLDERGHKACHVCGERFPFDDFPNNKSMPFGKLHNCRACHNERCRLQHRAMRANDPGFRKKAKGHYYKRTYGLTYEEYVSKLQGQDNKCAICAVRIEGKDAHLDHNHTTGALREFLCSNCNRGLGHLQENAAILQAAIYYLDKHNGNAAP